MSGYAYDAKRFPTSPGCYLMKDRDGRVIYVGKAKNLRSRLNSYFRLHLDSGRTRRLVAEICDIEVIVVNTECESVALENNLIKYHKPKYNRFLVRDELGIAYIALTGEEIPRFVDYRKRRFNKSLEGVKGKKVAKRFGPYVSTRFRDALLAFVIAEFKIRVCHPIPDRVCLRYHLGTCSGICESKISREAYLESVAQAVALLSYQHTDLIDRMRDRMLACAEDLEFERAHRIKEQIEALEKALEKQIVERDLQYDQDVVYFGERHVLVARMVRGKMQGLDLFDLDPAGDDDTACRSFLFDHYQAGSPVPQELIVNRIDDSDQVATALAAVTGRRVQITVPTRGVEYDLLKLCERNYRYRTRELAHVHAGGIL